MRQVETPLKLFSRLTFHWDKPRVTTSIGDPEPQEQPSNSRTISEEVSFFEHFQEICVQLARSSVDTTMSEVEDRDTAAFAQERVKVFVFLEAAVDFSLHILEA